MFATQRLTYFYIISHKYIRTIDKGMSLRLGIKQKNRIEIGYNDIVFLYPSTTLFLFLDLTDWGLFRLEISLTKII